MLSSKRLCLLRWRLEKFAMNRISDEELLSVLFVLRREKSGHFPSVNPLSIPSFYLYYWSKRILYKIYYRIQNPNGYCGVNSCESRS